ncbi:hypothetical protein Zm00014a_020065 [Zea mays]|uniref:Uncharacterized protein n=1 Tax=Zea mays TaxID=4577 RepID=A0A3L6FKV0_MAIZE|nr:hypothetical protein Zm00014a_020065 [Zea mays]
MRAVLHLVGGSLDGLMLLLFHVYFDHGSASLTVVSNVGMFLDYCTV